MITELNPDFNVFFFPHKQSKTSSETVTLLVTRKMPGRFHSAVATYAYGCQ